MVAAILTSLKYGIDLLPGASPLGSDGVRLKGVHWGDFFCAVLDGNFSCVPVRKRCETPAVSLVISFV